LTNLALRKQASQSSTGYGGDAGRAVDGKTDGNYSANSVSHTNNQPHQWWQVDLGAVYPIQSVRIWNRTDCCAERLSRFYVFVSDTPPPAGNVQASQNHPGVGSFFFDRTAGRTTDIPVNRNGRYVRVQLTGADYLQLAEVEVFGRGTPVGTPTTPPSTVGGWRSVGTGDCPGRDVASSTGPNPDPGKCTAAFAGFTAVCWANNCTYKNVPTAQCTGGVNPGRMYTCQPQASTPPPAVPAGTITWDFETGSLQGWTKTGTAFDAQPTYGDNPTARNRGQASKHQGSYWIGTYEKRLRQADPAGQVQGDEPQGTLTSQPFPIQRPAITFLIGGGCDLNTVRAELIVDGQAVLRATGKCSETMERVRWDVSRYQGKSAQIRLVDLSGGAWGHLNFDDVRLE
jgi:hypothetical protein